MLEKLWREILIVLMQETETHREHQLCFIVYIYIPITDECLLDSTEEVNSIISAGTWPLDHMVMLNVGVLQISRDSSKTCAVMSDDATRKMKCNVLNAWLCFFFV